VGLAAAALALALTNLIGGEALFQAGLVGVISTIGLGFAIAAFVVSWRRGSFLVAGLVGLSGISVMTPAFIALANINFAVIEIPGPIFGVIFGLAMLGLGVAKGIRTAGIITAVNR
jgi:hypothetical protein